ncbi:MAG: transcription termination factor Rho [Deltaproteobacteria bacterium]
MSEETHKKNAHKEHDEKHLDKLTIKELREVAAEFPHEKAVHDMKKEELIAFIREAKGIRGEGHIHKHKPKGKIKLTKPEVKAKIRELKVLHGQALEESDAPKAVLLRHQISRLKKISRRVAAA